MQIFDGDDASRDVSKNGAESATRCQRETWSCFALNCYELFMFSLLFKAVLFVSINGSLVFFVFFLNFDNYQFLN